MSFIAIEVDAGELFLGKDFNIRFSFRLPLPFADNTPVSSTYWFNFPANDANNVLLKHSNSLYVTNKLTSYNIKLRVAEVFYKGKILVQNASNKEYKALVIFNDIIENISQKQISDCVEEITVLGTNTDEVVASAKTMSQGAYPTQKYAFPQVRNETFFGDTNPDYTDNGKIINEYDRVNGWFNKNYIYDNVIYNRQVLIPMPYLLHIVESIFKKIGWNVGGSAMEDVNFRKLIYWNNYSLENIYSPDYLALQNINIWSPDYSPANHVGIGFNKIVSDESGMWNLQTYSMTCKKTGTYFFKFNANGHCDLSGPGTIWFEIFDGSAYTVLFSFTSEINGGSEEEFIGNGTKDLIENTVYTFFYRSNFVGQIYDINLQVSETEQGLNRFSNSIDIKNHVPRITVTEFLNQLSKKFFFAWFFDFENRTVEIEQWNNILDNNYYLDLSHTLIKDTELITIEDKSYSITTEWSADDLIEGNFKDLNAYLAITKVKTYADLPVPGILNQLAMVLIANKFYVTVLNTATNSLEWVAGFDNFYDIKSDVKDAIPLNTIINTLFMRENNVIYPEIKQQGSNTVMGINDQGFKLLNYHGFVTNYPFASNTNYNQDGTKTTGIAMQVHGTDGTYEKYGKKLIEYLKNSNPVEMDLKINSVDFYNIIKLYAAKNKKRKVRIGNKNYLPESIDITVSNNSIENCKIKLL